MYFATRARENFNNWKYIKDIFLSVQSEADTLKVLRKNINFVKCFQGCTYSMKEHIVYEMNIFMHQRHTYILIFSLLKKISIAQIDYYLVDVYSHTK